MTIILLRNLSVFEHLTAD